MYKPWFVYFAALLLLGCIGIMAASDEQATADHYHRDYCQRVAIYQNSLAYGGPLLGHRDYENKCTTEDLQKAREALSYE